MRRTLISGLLTSAGLSAATIAGSVFDPSGTAIPTAQASLYNPDTAARQELTTTPEGKFAFGNLTPGWYRLNIEKPGFASLYREFNVAQNSDVHRGLTLRVAAPRDKQLANPQDQPAHVAGAHPLDPELIRVGGKVQQEKLIAKIQPQYPASAKSAGLQGTVELEVVISKEGFPEDIRVVSSPGDDLTESALEAVRQWRYSPTLLNGQPVGIITAVIVNYTLLK